MATPPTGNPPGRPTLYDPAHCDVVIELGKQGKSKAQMAAHLNVVRDTLYEWAQVHPEFSDALSRATEHSLSWWEDLAQTRGLTREFNAATWAKSMSARFPADYREQKQQIELTGKDGGPVQMDDSTAAAKLAAFIATAQQRKGDTELA